MNKLIIIDHILGIYRVILGKDFAKYRNHACRVYFLCTLLDNNIEQHEKYAVAAAFHDLGIWTNNTFDYIDPSTELAKNWLTSEGKQDWIIEISEMIGMHHKIKSYSGTYEQTVETFRKADWIDLSYGMLKYKIPGKQFRELLRKFSTKGFHRFLLRKSFLNFFRHPLNPLPMFKK